MKSSFQSPVSLCGHFHLVLLCTPFGRILSVFQAVVNITKEIAMEQVTESRPFVPGTVHLVDLEGTMRAKHASKGHKDIVLVPAPSNDPDDPLNWSPRRKLLSTSCMCMYTLMVGIASAAIYSVLVPVSEATGLTLGDLNSGTGYMCTCLHYAII